MFRWQNIMRFVNMETLLEEHAKQSRRKATGVDGVTKDEYDVDVHQQTLPSVEPLSMEEVSTMAERALKTIPPRVAHYARLLGVTYGRITIRNQRTRWGSCSSKGNLNFNCLLMLTPPEVVDSVIVHELSHLKEMNHSDRFYREVLRIALHTRLNT